MKPRDEALATQSASPTAAAETRTGEPSPTPHVPRDRASAATQIHDPERYQIIGEHGRGGLGRVSRAHDRDLGRDVAIKELISRGNVNEVRFLREALITARLEHPGIVAVHEAGRWPDGTPFYAMKLVAGRPLRDLIAERQTVAERIGLLHHVIAVADAIAYAHGCNIIHRDLKPANVIVGEFGETIVIDWGLAKDLSDDDEVTVGGGPFRAHHDTDLTATGSILGTPAYMAPEQERGEHVDQRADVFAIGAMLWELCARQRVPPAAPQVRRRVLRAGGIDQDLVAIIDKALAADPAQRYPHAGALAADLKAFKSGARIAARNYSLLAMLAHWTRRHRALAVSVVTAFALAAAGIVMYVHDISAERDRTRATLTDAQRERDRAQLAEVSLLLETDPTRAKASLGALTVRSPQYAFLLSRARQQAATHAVKLSGNATRLVRNPVSGALAVTIVGGDLDVIDVDTGTMAVLDHDLRGAIAPRGPGWSYARRPFGGKRVTIATTGASQVLDAGPLLTDLTGELVIAGSQVYAFENHDLYTFTDGQFVRSRRDVRAIAGSGRVVLICSMANELEVLVDGAVVHRARCATTKGATEMTIAGLDYAVLPDRDHVLVMRGGQALELAARIPGPYALSLATSGLLALADFEGKTWFVRPGSDRLEVGPAHAARPASAAADGRYAAWGYVDGSVIALDTETGTTWEFQGHNALVSYLAIDAARARVSSVTQGELRIWTLAPSPLKLVAHLPCKAFNLALSPDRTQAALDCSDGTLRVWTLATGEIATYRHHDNLAFGVAWMRDLACTSGFDGHVRCSGPGSAEAQEILSGTESIRWMIASPDRAQLVMAVADGKIVAYDGAPRTLYTHDAQPYRMAFSPDGALLASGDADGRLIVYDMIARRIIASLRAHTGLVMSVAWRGRDLWTAGADGNLTHWRYVGGETGPGTLGALAWIETLHKPGSFRLLRLLGRGWCANVEDQAVLIHVDDQTWQLDTGRHLTSTSVSSDERYITATMSGRVVIVDLVRRAIATVAIPSDGIGVVAFVAPDRLAISSGTELYSVDVRALPYTTF